MFDDLVASTTGAHGARGVDVWARVENAACARRLAAMVTVLDAAYAADGSANRDQWCIDNWAAVCAHVGAAQRITSGAASGQLLIGMSLRERFPRVAVLFADGLIGYSLVRAIVSRGALVVDPDALRALDCALAEALRCWEPMSLDKTERTLDAFIAQVDPHAVRRTETKARARSVEISVEDGSGLATVYATVFAHDAKALDARTNALADTVCPADPRTKDQRRADAMGALSHGADRLACLCETNDCPAAELPPSTGVVVYVVAHEDTIDGPTTPPATEAPQPDEPLDESTPKLDGPEAEAACNDAAPSDTVDDAAPHQPADSADEGTGLDGERPALFAKPLRELTLTEALTPEPGYLATIRPAAMMGGHILPWAITRRAAVGATIVPILHPGLAPPEPRYRPSKKLADFVRCRDMTCRFPGCHEPATNCDLDHTTPWPYGPTAASNLKALCRRHHLLKTFWGGENGWRDQQLDDGTIIWTAPDGRTHTTAPGSRLLFPELSETTAPVTVNPPPPPGPTIGLTMPLRRKTRAEDRAGRVAYERELNQVAIEHEAAREIREPHFNTAHSHPRSDPDPPPF